MRDFLDRLHQAGKLVRITRPVQRDLQAAGLLKALDGRAALLEQVEGFDARVAGNLFSSRELIAQYFGVATEEIIPMMMEAISNPSEPEVITGPAPCQELVLEGDEVDLDRVPILRHCAGDGGNYVSAGVVKAGHPELGQNLDFHRCMQIGRDAFTMRVVRQRHFERFLRDQGCLQIALCVGNPANVMLAAATSVGIGQDELHIANTLEPIRLVRARTSDLLIPADCEWVFEGTVDLQERDDEGPFVDITETEDIVRQEPVFRVQAITCRQDAIWQALLPGGLEHKVMMGMPREPTIFEKVNEAGVRCLDVSITPGGCSWLHAVIQIEVGGPSDGEMALRAAFEGHGSLKHAWVVDADIDVHDPLHVEWAMATRFQGDRDLVVLGREKGSSLDPSGDPGTHHTCKVGFDLTRYGGSARGEGAFERVSFSRVELAEFLGTGDAGEAGGSKEK